MSKVEIARFNGKPRSNFAIEILRFSSLILLLFTHSCYIGVFKFNSPFIEHLNSTAGHSFNVFAFTAITGIYTIGKGKDYFLRNLSRLAFVVIAFLVIMIPLYYKTNVHSANFNYDLTTVIFGGRDTWYLWQIAIISIFLPLINIKKWLSINPILNIVFAILLIAPWCTELFSVGYISAAAKLFCIAFAAYILFFTYSHFREQEASKNEFIISSHEQQHCYFSPHLL